MGIVSPFQTLHQRGRAAYPDLGIDEGTFAAYLHRDIGPGPGSTPESIPPDLWAEDLYLACACVQGIPGAAEKFLLTYGNAIRAALAVLSMSSGLRDELEQQIHEELLLGRGDSAPKIGRYLGHGPLARWVSVVAQRTALMKLRANASEARARDAVAFELSQGAVDGELVALKKRCRPVVDQAIREAVSNLSDRDRVVLRLHFVGGAGVKKIGSIYGVSPSTVSRWVAQIRNGIRRDVHHLLGHRLQVPSDEIESLIALVVSQLDISLGDARRP